MKKDSKTQLKDKFLSITTWVDLVDLALMYQEIDKGFIFTKPLRKQDISYLLFGKGVSKYQVYQIPKKKQGAFRTIEVPTVNLKILQKILLDCITLCFTPKSSAHGFVAKRNIVTNANQHKRCKYVYNLDLENFFPSIHFGRVKGVFKRHPFCFSEEIANSLASLCCNDIAVLPQGAPSSPIISNLVCRNLDWKLTQFAIKNKLRYTRYADDITFSSNINVFDMPDFLTELKAIIEGESFKINVSKTRLQNSKQRQEVTGLTVNKKVNVTPKYINDLRFLLHLFLTKPDYGKSWHEKNYTKRHRYDNKVPEIKKVLEGKLDFLKMVIGKDSSRYLSLVNKFNEKINAIKEETKSQEDKLKELQKIEIIELKEDFKKQFERIAEAISDNELSSFLIEIKENINKIGDDPHLKESKIELSNQFEKTILSLNHDFLIKNLLQTEIQNPFELVNNDILTEMNKQIEPKKYQKHIPQYLSEFLRLFRTPSSFNSLVHTDSRTYNDIVASGLRINYLTV